MFSKLQLQAQMEQSTSVTRKKVENYIPDDLSFSILSKLPLKSLKRFGSVCKLWSLLFENPHFMGIFRNNFIYNHDSYYNYTCLFLHQFDDLFELHSLSGEGFENRVKLELPNPFPEFRQPFILDSGSVNGTLLLYIPNMKLALWNPAIEEVKLIPLSPNELVEPSGYHIATLQGFGYDNITHDSKLIRYVCFSKFIYDDYNYKFVFEDYSYDPLWEIYSVRSNSWRKLDYIDIPRCRGHIGGERLYKDGMCYWLGMEDRHEHWLVSFDLGNEVFCTTQIPFDVHDNTFFTYLSRYLIVLNGYIALISTYEDTSPFHISILGELGVKESWTKLFIIGPLPCVIRPIGVGKKGNIFFIKEDGEHVLYDLGTQKLQELGVRKGKYRHCRSYIVIYKESLLPIGEIIN